MGRFGQSAAEREESFGDIWIKGFKDGATRIRIVQEPPTWHTYRHHFGYGGYFPCTEDATCIGCNHPSEETQRQARQYAFNAFDDQGRLNIYRLGTRAYKVMKSRHTRLGTVLDRDYTVVRSGKFQDTMYDLEPGEKYEVELPAADALLDFYEALDQAYKNAERNKAKEEAAETEAVPEPTPSPAEDSGTKAEPKKAAIKPKAEKPAEDVEAVAKQVEAELAADAGAQQPEGWDAVAEQAFEDMSTPDLVAYLEARNVELPPRTPRTKMIKMCKDAPAF